MGRKTQIRGNLMLGHDSLQNVLFPMGAPGELISDCTLTSNTHLSYITIKTLNDLWFAHVCWISTQWNPFESCGFCGLFLTEDITHDITNWQPTNHHYPLHLGLHIKPTDFSCPKSHLTIHSNKAVSLQPAFLLNHHKLSEIYYSLCHTLLTAKSVHLKC